MSIISWFILGVILIYLVFMIVTGAVFSKKNKNSGDFYLGGRKLGPLVTAMSAEASDMSSWLLMGLPGLALMSGVAEAGWTAIGLAVGTYINWLIVARRIRVYSSNIGAITLPEFFSKRFGDSKKMLTVISALFIVVFFIPYTASGFSACGKLFSSIFGMNYTTAMLISAAVIVIYCTLGGFLAASTTDFIQSIIMTFALFVVIGFGAVVTGGFGAVFENVRNMSGYLNLFKGFDVAAGKTSSYGAVTIVSTLAWGLGYFGMPHILLRFMAIEDENKLKTSRRIASVWVVISMAAAILIGIIGYSLMKGNFVPAYENSSSAETVIVDIAGVISNHGYLAAIVGGLILAGILASTMSTADSQLLAASSSISQDLIQNTFKVKLSEKKSMVLARTSVIIISIIAVFLALDSNSSVFRIVSFAWAGFGATFGPVMLFALFWKRANKWGALAGMLSGGVTIFIWKFVIRSAFSGTVLDIYELLPAFIVSCIFIVVVSLLTEKPSAEIEEQFEAVKAK
ncbi:MAG: sodium/proline symporter PutP [Clostridia bacterium]|nr:sodium/proline symporter PutP [Clostridia bacterium]